MGHGTPHPRTPRVPARAGPSRSCSRRPSWPPSQGGRTAAELAVVEIDPAVADTAAMSEAYDLGMDTGANCVVVAGKRDGEERVAACLVRADTRADVNNVVKRTLDVRKCSFLSMDRAVEESGMEYGGITPVGLPAAVAAAGRLAGARHRGRGDRVRRTALQAADPRPARGRAAGRRGDRGNGGLRAWWTRTRRARTRSAARARPSARTASGTTCSRSCASSRPAPSSPRASCSRCRSSSGSRTSRRSSSATTWPWCCSPPS